MNLDDVVILAGIFLKNVLILLLLIAHLLHGLHHFGLTLEDLIQSIQLLLFVT